MLVNKDAGKPAALISEDAASGDTTAAARAAKDTTSPPASSASAAPLSEDEFTIAPPSLFPPPAEVSSSTPRSTDRRLNLVALRLNLEHSAKEAVRGLERASKIADATATAATAAEKRMATLVAKAAGEEVERSVVENRRRLRHEGEDSASYKWEEDEKMRRLDDERAVTRRLDEERAAAEHRALLDYDDRTRNDR